MVSIGILYTNDKIPDVSWNPGDDIVRDGQRFLLESILGRDNIRWVVINRNRPAAWFGAKPGDFLWDAHPKLVYPYWWTAPVRRDLPPATCDYFFNASGPLLYYGARCHTALEPWYGALSRILKQRNPRPRFLNIALGTSLALPYSRRNPAYGLLGSAAVTLARNSVLTTCRGAIAQEMLADRGIDVPLVPCPSLLARLHHGIEPVESKGYIAVNLHPRGTRTNHRGLDAEKRWLAICREVLEGLRRFNRPVRLIFHETLERALAEHYFPEWLEGAMQPVTIEEFIRAYGEAEIALTSRIHGAYAAASMGVPSACIVSDTRGAMINVLGLPSMVVGRTTSEEIVARMAEIVADRQRLRERLLPIPEAARQQYVRLLTATFEREGLPR